MMWGYHPMMSAGWGIGAAIISIIFWIVIALIIVFVIRAFIRGSHMHHMQGMHHWGNEDSAIRILKERYAKGEIDKKEFEEKTKDLTKQ